jgi:hypothetical protein
MIHTGKWTHVLNHPFDLPELSHIASRIERPDDVDRYGKADFIWLMGYVAGNHVVTPVAKFGDQP